MKKTYCDICKDEMEFHPNWDSVKKQSAFSFLNIHVDMGNASRYFRIGSLPSIDHMTEICEDCWGDVMVKIAHGEFTLSVNHHPVYRGQEDSQ